MKKIIRRNEIYLVDLGETIGSEQRGKRPVLILQNNIGNKYSTTTIVAPFTRRIESKNSIPTHVHIKPIGSKISKGTIMLEQIRVIDKKRIIKYIGKLPRQYDNKISKALKIAFKLYNRRNLKW